MIVMIMTTMTQLKFFLGDNVMLPNADCVNYGDILNFTGRLRVSLRSHPLNWTTSLGEDGIE